MTDLAYTFEGNADEATITTSDTGAGDAFDLVNLPAQGGSPSAAQAVYDDDGYVASGTFGGRLRSTDAGSTFVGWSTSLAATTATSHVRIYLDRPASLPGNRAFCTIRSASANIFTARWTSSGAVALLDAGGTVRYTSSHAFSSGDDFRFEARVSHDAANGHIQGELYYGANIDGTTPDESMGSATDNWNTGTTSVVQVRFGALTTAAAATNETVALDEVAFSDVDWVGPVGGGGGGGGGGTPATLPSITAPDTTGWTTITDPNPSAVWTPSLAAGTDYILTHSAPWVRSKRLNVSGGRNVYIADLTIDIDVAGGCMLDVRAGDSARDVFLEDVHLTNTAGVESDGIRGSQAAGGNIATGAGGTTLRGLRVRVDSLQGSQAGVHADGIQLPGGMREIWFQDSTFQSGYVCMQLQREQFVPGAAPLRAVTALTRSGTTGTVTVSGGLAIAVGSWVELTGQTPTEWRSTWQVLSILTGTSPNVTRFTVFLGDGGQGTATVLGNAQLSEFVNYVGDVNLKNVNMRRQANASGDPTQTLTAIRIPAGRPDSKGSNAEDRTPLLVDGMAGNLTMDTVWIEPNAGETIADMVEPSTASAVYDLAQGVEDTAPTPDEFSWPDHPQIFGIIFEGVPGGGDFAPAPGGGATGALQGTLGGITGSLAGNVTGGVSGALQGTLGGLSGQLAGNVTGPAAAGPVFGQPSAKPLSDVAWTVDGYPIGVVAPSFSDNAGGYDQMRGEVAASEWLGVQAFGADQGSEVIGWSEGKVVWAGKLSTRPLIAPEQTAQITAQGFKHGARKLVRPLFIQARGLDGWTPTDSEPHLNAAGNPVYPTNKRFNVDLDGSRALFTLERDITFSDGQRSGIIFYREGVDLARVAWTESHSSVDDSSNVKIQPYRANGPTGTETAIGAGHLLNDANNGDAQSETFASNPRDLVMLMVETVNDHTNSVERRSYRLSRFRVNSTVHLGDELEGAAVIRHIAAEMGWDGSGISDGLYNVLPFVHDDGDWLEAGLYIAALEDRFLRVGRRAVEYGEWGKRTWTCAQSTGSAPDLISLERYDAVRVWYTHVNGVKRHVLVESDEYPALGNTFEFELADEQDDSDVATAVATRILDHVSRQRVAGSVEVPQAVADDGCDDVRQIRYGDSLVIADFAPAQALRLRVMEVNQGRGVVVGVERPLDPEMIENRIGRKKVRA